MVAAEMSKALVPSGVASVFTSVPLDICSQRVPSPSSSCPIVGSYAAHYESVDQQRPGKIGQEGTRVLRALVNQIVSRVL
jgi:hypothetical protein